MPIIVCQNSKGGVAKTTTSIFLASAAQRAGYQVTLIDADAQGSATQWYEDARQEDEHTVDGVTLTVANVATLRRLKDAGGVTIIDTPPGDAPVIEAAVNAADFVVIPSLPSLRDMPRVWQVLDTIPANKLAAVLLVSVHAGARLPAEARAALESEDVPVFPTEIPQWEAFRQAGSWPRETQRGTEYYDAVFAQIMEALN